MSDPATFSSLRVKDSWLLPPQSSGQTKTNTTPRCDCFGLYCTVLYCTALHCTVLYCTALYFTALHCTALHCTALYFTALHCTVIYCTALYWVCTLTRGGEYREIPGWGRGSSRGRSPRELPRPNAGIFCTPRLESRYRHYPIYKSDVAVAIVIAIAMSRSKAMSKPKAKKETD